MPYMLSDGARSQESSEFVESVQSGVIGNLHAVEQMVMTWMYPCFRHERTLDERARIIMEIIDDVFNYLQWEDEVVRRQILRAQPVDICGISVISGTQYLIRSAPRVPCILWP